MPPRIELVVGEVGKLLGLSSQPVQVALDRPLLLAEAVDSVGVLWRASGGGFGDAGHAHV